MTWEKKTFPYPNFHYLATDGDSRQKGTSQCQISLQHLMGLESLLYIKGGV